MHLFNQRIWLRTNLYEIKPYPIFLNSFIFTLTFRLIYFKRIIPVCLAKQINLQCLEYSYITQPKTQFTTDSSDFENILNASFDKEQSLRYSQKL